MIYQFLAGVAFMGGWFYFEMMDWPRTATSMMFCAILILFSKQRRSRVLPPPGSSLGWVQSSPRTPLDLNAASEPWPSQERVIDRLDRAVKEENWPIPRIHRHG